jgi:hypothetical protein
MGWINPDDESSVSAVRNVHLALTNLHSVRMEDDDGTVVCLCATGGSQHAGDERGEQEPHDHFAFLWRFAIISSVTPSSPTKCRITVWNSFAADCAAWSRQRTYGRRNWTP